MTLPGISHAEWQVMKVVWSQSPVTANEVIEALADSTDWKPKTIMTMLKRLVDKGALSYRKQGRAFQYYPLVKQEQCVKEEGRSFLQRVYDGSLIPVLANFVEQVDLSEEEIAELKELLDQKAAGKRRRKGRR